MIALVLADIDDIHWHGQTGTVDLVISCGDVDDNLLKEAAEAYSCKAILAVRGNHDRSAPFADNVVDLHLNRVDVLGLTFGGFQGSWKYKPRGHYLYEQDQVEMALRDFPSVDVFVAHNSPRGIHDKEDEIHYGFDAFNNYLRTRRPQIFIHGHQHVQVQSRVEGTLVTGAYGAQLLELPGGKVIPSVGRQE
jgi:Icc-related predicted phosphoesterase